MSNPIFKALSITERKQKTPLTLLDYDEPTLGAGEFLIQNVAVAQNPVDWKQIDYDFNIPTIPWVLGGDAAGRVYKVGAGVTEFVVGDRVTSFLSRKTARYSAYQTYSIGEVGRTVKLPTTYSFEEGSTIPLAYTTAGAGLVHALDVKLPLTFDAIPKNSANEPLLVWGGSSSVGAFVVQLASWAGYTVIATASSAHHEYVKSLGASYVFDYHNDDVVEKIRSVAGDNLSRVYDAISTEGTIRQSIASITAPTGGTVASVLGVPAALPNPFNKVKIVGTGAIQAFNNPQIGKDIYALLTHALEKRQLVPNPVRVIPGGLIGVNEGLDLGRKNKVSGEKLVYLVEETKF